MIDIWDERVSAAEFGLIFLLYAWVIYSRKNIKLPYVIPGMKLQMVGFLLMGIAPLLKYLSLTHTTIPPKLGIAFALPGAIVAMIGSVMILRKYYQNRRSPSGKASAQPHNP